MTNKYGNFSSTQISSTKSNIRKSIFFLLLYVDPQTRDQYSGVNVQDAFLNLQNKLSGLNSLLFNPPELVEVMSLVEAAWQEYTSESFDFRRYRKLILDAGSEIMKVGDSDGN